MKATSKTLLVAVMSLMQHPCQAFDWGSLAVGGSGSGSGSGAAARRHLRQPRHNKNECPGSYARIKGQYYCVESDTECARYIHMDGNKRCFRESESGDDDEQKKRGHKKSGHDHRSLSKEQGHECDTYYAYVDGERYCVEYAHKCARYIRVDGKKECVEPHAEHHHEKHFDHEHHRRQEKEQGERRLSDDDDEVYVNCYEEVCYDDFCYCIAGTTCDDKVGKYCVEIDDDSSDDDTDDWYGNSQWITDDEYTED